MCTCVRGQGLGQVPLCDFFRILDGRPCSSLCGRPRRESQEVSCNFDKASKKDVTLRRRGDDENGNASNPTKIMLEAGVCRGLKKIVLSPHILIEKTSRCKSCYRRNSSQSDQTGNSFLL